MSFPAQPRSHGEPSRSKVQIPRLPQKRKGPPSQKAAVNRVDRVSRACLTCRSRKVKCDGGTPRCSNCRDNATTCVYASSRRDRLKIATTHNQDMVALLRELRTQVPNNEQLKIDSLLSAVAEDIADAVTTVQKSPDRHLHQTNDEEEPGEANISADVGSNGEQDLVDEDLMQNEATRATGYIGKASEIQWLRGLHRDDGHHVMEGPYGPPGSDLEAATERLAALRRRQENRSANFMHTSKASYYLDDEILDTDFMVEPTDMPPFETAERLVLAYMESCHNTFPFLAKKAFMKEFYHYYAALAGGNPYLPPQKWQATLNLVFAIGAVYSHLTSADWRADERDHFMYYARAVALGLQDPWWFSHPDLPQMQITGLLSFYYLIIGRVNRAWIMIGLAMRFAYALGLHMRNEDPSAGNAKKEVLGRIWWAHFAFDRFLSATIGRPSQGVDRTASVPLPLPITSADIDGAIIQSRFGDQLRLSTGLLPRHQPSMTSQSPSSSSVTGSFLTGSETANSGTYLKNVVQLCEIIQGALYLYSSGTAVQSWQSVQKIIAALNEELEVWATSLPDGLNFSKDRTEQRYLRERSSLEILYHNTKILINRPCLCRLDRRIEHQTASSNDFNERAASTCVASAMAIARSLADDPTKHVTSIYENGPWWNMVHAIMQSLVVLLLEISLHPQDCQDVVLDLLKKLVRWLRAMRANSGVARRAYAIAFDLLRKVATSHDLDILDLLHEDAQASLTTRLSPPPFTTAAVDTQSPNLPSNSGPGLAPTTTHGQYYSYVNPAFTHPAGFQQDDTEYSSTHEFMDYTAPGQWDVAEQTFPGLFYTSFDEQTPLPGFGAQDYEARSHQADQSQGSPHFGQ